MRICLMMVDLPDSPAPGRIHQPSSTSTELENTGVPTKQQDLNSAIHRLLITFDHPVNTGVARLSIPLWPDGLGSEATHDVNANQLCL